MFEVVLLGEAPVQGHLSPLDPILPCPVYQTPSTLSPFLLLHRVARSVVVSEEGLVPSSPGPPWSRHCHPYPVGPVLPPTDEVETSRPEAGEEIYGRNG